MITRNTIAQGIWFLFFVALLFAVVPGVLGLAAFPFFFFVPFVVASLLFAGVYVRRDSGLVWSVLAAAATQLLLQFGMLADPNMSVVSNGTEWRSVVVLPPSMLVAVWIVATLLPPLTAILVLCRLRRDRE